MSSTDLLKEEKYYAWDFGINLTINNPNGEEFYLEAPLQTQDLIPEEVLKLFYKTAHNKEVRSFHIPPEEDLDSHIGNVDRVWWDETTNKPWCRIEIFNNSPWAREVREIILEDMNKPYEERRIKGVSAGVVEYRNKTTGDIEEIYIREVSIARNPACEICTFKNIILNETNNVIILKEKKLEEIIKVSEKTEPSQNDKNYDSIIKVFEGRLHDKDSKIAEYESTIAIQMETISAQKIDADKLKKELENFEKVKTELSELKKDAETFNDRHKLVTKFQKIEAGSEEYKAKMEKLGKLPTEALDMMLEDYERVYTLNEKGLTQQKGKPVLDNPQMRKFDGIDPTKVGKDHVKEIDKIVDEGASGQYDGTGGY